MASEQKDEIASGGRRSMLATDSSQTGQKAGQRWNNIFNKFTEVHTKDFLLSRAGLPLAKGWKSRLRVYQYRMHACCSGTYQRVSYAPPLGTMLWQGKWRWTICVFNYTRRPRESHGRITLCSDKIEYKSEGRKRGWENSSLEIQYTEGVTYMHDGGIHS